jgi:hypothetical protein
MSVSGKLKSLIEGCDKNICCQTGLLQNNDKLVKLFEILIQIDQRQKNNQQNQ